MPYQTSGRIRGSGVPEERQDDGPGTGAPLAVTTGRCDSTSSPVTLFAENRPCYVHYSD